MERRSVGVARRTGEIFKPRGRPKPELSPPIRSIDGAGTHKSPTKMGRSPLGEEEPLFKLGHPDDRLYRKTKRRHRGIPLEDDKYPERLERTAEERGASCAFSPQREGLGHECVTVSKAPFRHGLTRAEGTQTR